MSIDHPAQKNFRAQPSVRWRRDLLTVALVTASIAGIAIVADVSETVFHASRRFEHLQLDELPIVLLVLASCLIWFAWRRHRETLVELTRRDAAERKLAELLGEHRRLGHQYVEAQESEHKHLARELHDEAGQYLNAIKTYAVSIQSSTTGEASRAASMVIEHADRAYEAVRNIIRQLRPVGLDELGLKAALEHLVEQTQSRYPLTKLQLRLEGDLDTLVEPNSLTIYRLAQEGLTNVAKHAHATKADLHIARSADIEQVDFRLSDDGRGCDPSAPRAGVGLIGMRERVEMLGGEWRIDSAPSRGFAIFARIPLSSPGAA